MAAVCIRGLQVSGEYHHYTGEAVLDWTEFMMMGIKVFWRGGPGFR
jgi:hypothetical protein